MRATYSPDDNKLRLYTESRLSEETYRRVKGAGFIWAPKQGFFVAPMWTPAREDFLLELCGEVEDEDTSLMERAEERAERFDEYHERRKEEAERAHTAVKRIADQIPFGQPILVGHHSERHARRDAERIENGMRKTLRLWETSEYWQRRATAALHHARYKERPEVRARRIKKIEAEKRKMERQKKQSQIFLKVWRKVHDPNGIKRKDGAATTFKERALYLANNDRAVYGLWSDLTDDKLAPEQAQQKAISLHESIIGQAERWILHYENRLTYERAMLEDSGGIAADHKPLEIGGAVKCWASPRGGWSYITRVNIVSVTVLDNWGNGGENFPRTIPFDKLTAVMTRAEVEAKRQAKKLYESSDKTGFFLTE